MLPDRVSNPGPLTYESGALPIALRGPAKCCKKGRKSQVIHQQYLWDGFTQRALDKTPTP